MGFKDYTSRNLSRREEASIQWAREIGSLGPWSETKYPLEAQWMTNIAFMMGYQDLSWDNDRGRPIERRYSSHKSRYVANKVLAKAEMLQAILSESSADWAVTPSTRSREDQLAARVGKQLLEKLWVDMEMQTVKVPELIQWAIVCGTGFLYNTTASNPRTRERIYVDPQTGNPIPGSLMRDAVRSHLDKMGSYIDYSPPAPDVEVMSPFRVMFDPRATSVETARYMVNWRVMHLDEVYERWGALVPSEALPAGMLQYEDRLRSFFGPTEGYGLAVSSATNMKEGDYTVVQEVVAKPHLHRTMDGVKEYANGRHVIIAGGVPLRDGENEFYKAGFQNGFPVTEFVYHKMPGRLWGKAAVEDMLDPNRAYNQTRRDAMDFFRVMGSPKWLSPVNAKLKRRAIDDRPGEIIEFSPMGGMAPQPVTPTPFQPALVDNLAAGAVRDLEDASSMHSASHSFLPSDMRTGPAMQLAAEGDSMAKNPIVGRLERCVGMVGENTLLTAAKVMLPDQFIELLGSDYGPIAPTFTAAMLKGVKSVKVKRGSMRPSSAATEASMALDAVQTQALDPAGNRGDRAIVLRALNYEGFDPDMVSLEQERERAGAEMDMMMAIPGTPDFGLAQVQVFDDDDVHIEVHSARMRTREFQLLPEPQKQMVLGHLQEHLQNRQRAVEAQQQMLLMAKGAPGPKGRPSPPKQQAQR